METLLTYEEFKTYCLTNIPKVLGEDEYTTEFFPLQKTDNLVVDTIQVGRKDQKDGFTCSVPVQDCYELYRGGKTLGDTMLDMIRQLEDRLGYTLDFDLLASIRKFEHIKDRLIIRAISYRNNKKLLTGYVYKLYGDIALVIYSMIKQDKEGLLTTKIPKKNMDDWGVPTDLLFRTANENTSQKYRPTLIPLEKSVIHHVQEEMLPPNRQFFMEPLVGYRLEPSRIGHKLSTEMHINGATAVFYSGVLKKLGELFHDDLYIVFTSIHEAMIHPVNRSDLRFLKECARDMPGYPETVRDETELLSSNVYRYSAKANGIKVV